MPGFLGKNRYALALVIAWAAATIGAPGRVARAESDADKAETLIRQGLDLRRTGDDQKAYPLFRQAYATAPSARSAGQLGLCEQALGSWVDAETHLAEALRTPNDKWLKKNRAAIEQALMLVKSHIARVEITGTPAGANVFVNGASVGQLPLAEAVRVTAGEVEIELRAPGSARARKVVRAEGAQYLKVSLAAEKAPDPPASAGVPATPAPAGAAAAGAAGAATGAGTSNTSAGNTSAAAGATHGNVMAGPSGDAVTGSPATASAADDGGRGGSADRAPPPSRSAGGGRRSLKFVSWGLAAGALGAGVYGILHNRSLVNTFDSGCGLDDAGTARVSPGAPAGFSDGRCADLKKQYQTASAIGIVGLAAGAVLAGAGFVLWGTEPRDGETGTARLSCAPLVAGPRDAFVGCAARF